MTAQDASLTQATPQPRFSMLRSLKIGTFHIGSSMTDVIFTGIWNRVMISDLGTPATPVSLILAVRYLLAPLAIWAGHASDSHPILGSRRVAYIWLGRLLMLLALPLLPVSVGLIARDLTSPAGWILALVSSLLFGTGTPLSGAPYLALVHDSAPYERRGQAVSITQFLLVVSFAFVPAIYAIMMPSYDQALFWRLVLAGMAGAAFFWFFAIVGEESRGGSQPGSAPAKRVPIGDTLRAIWADQRTRRYAFFLGGSAFFAFMQDNVLEPFGGDVFGLSVGDTTRFTAYWGGGALVAMVLTYAATRKRTPDQQVSTTAAGLAILALAILLLVPAAVSEALHLIRPVLILFGLGFGIFTVGGVSLLMAMSKPAQAASYLALWSVIQLTSRGLGSGAGGIARDLALWATGRMANAYAAVFLLEGLGLLVCIWLLRRVDVRGFAAGHGVTAQPPIPLID